MSTPFTFWPYYQFPSWTKGTIFISIIVANNTRGPGPGCSFQSIHKHYDKPWITLDYVNKFLVDAVFRFDDFSVEDISVFGSFALLCRNWELLFVFSPDKCFSWLVHFARMSTTIFISRDLHNHLQYLWQPWHTSWTHF